MLGRYAEGRTELLLIEADDELIPYEDYGYSHLTALVDHLLALLHVGGNVVFRVLDIVLREELLGELAKMARRGAINGDWFIHRLFLGLRSIARSDWG